MVGRFPGKMSKAEPLKCGSILIGAFTIYHLPCVSLLFQRNVNVSVAEQIFHFLL